MAVAALEVPGKILTRSLFIMSNVTLITADMKMADIVHMNHNNLLIINRFNIPLGFGEQTIDEVCQKAYLPTNLFLMICNIHSNQKIKISELDVPCCINKTIMFLRNAHNYYRKIRIPEIKRALVSLAKFYDKNIEKALSHFFNEYSSEVKKHLLFEENVLFPYILELSQNAEINTPKIKSEIYHQNIEDKLTDLKNIIIKYMSLPEHDMQKIDLLDKLFHFQEDLDTHTLIEDLLLSPIVEQLEKNIQK